MNMSSKSQQTRPRPSLSKEELLQQITTLLESPEDDMHAALMRELLAGVLKMHDAHLDLLDGGFKFQVQRVKDGAVARRLPGA